MTDSDWTDERVARLKSLWAEGFSASQVAYRLGGGVTRNAVIGKLHRLKLHRHKNAPQARKPPQFDNPRQRPPSLAPEAVSFTAGTWEPLPGSAPVILEQLKGCKWPVSDPFAPRGSIDLFCNCTPISPDKPYCHEHAARSVGAGSSLERAAVKFAIDANKAEWRQGERAREAA